MESRSAEPLAEPPWSSGQRLRLGLWVCLGLAGLGLSLWALGQWRSATPVEQPNVPRQEPPPPDPRLAYKGPYRNIHPQVQFVGDRACVGCHRAESEGFHRHPMGRSMVPIAQLPQRYDAGVHNPFRSHQSRFTVERNDGRIWHKQERLDPQGQVLATIRTEVAYAIGSGSRGHSYFTSRDGFLFQTPISWYTQKQIWDLSPGFRNARLRPITAECLFCHTNRVRPVEYSSNRFEAPVFPEPSIGCERCHGPGEAHVKARRNDEAIKGRIDYTIVNPRYLPPAQREAICQQCHLEGAARVLRRGRGLFDFRPGLPLDDFWAIYVPAPGMEFEQRAVSQVEQMYASKCFQASKGKLGCATCHDVHDPLEPAQRLAFHRTKCLSCHRTEHPCSLELTLRLQKSKEDSCIECHMTRLHSDDIAHTASTDHRIPRWPLPPRAAEGTKRPPLPEVPLVPFHGSRKSDPDADRDLGLALVEAARAKGGPFRFYLPRASALLTKAAETRRSDLELQEYLARALRMQDQSEEALEAYLRLLAAEPKHERAARSAAALALHLKRFDVSLRTVQTALALNPWFTDGYMIRALLLIRDRRYAEAAGDCRKLLELEPTRADAWMLLAVCHRGLGKPKEAARDEERADALESDHSGTFRALLDSVLR